MMAGAGSWAGSHQGKLSSIGMIGGAGVCLLAVCLPKLAIANINSAGMMAGDDSWQLSHLPHLAIYKQPPTPANCPAPKEIPSNLSPATAQPLNLACVLVVSAHNHIKDIPAPKTTLNHKKLGKWGKWENDTSKAIYIKAYTVFPYFRQMGKWGKYGENE